MGSPRDGSLVRILMENLMTYTSMEFRPDTNLNIVLAPNGSGKSTLICGVILGLGGKPQAIGRSSRVQDYVRYGANKAMIELELFNSAGSNYIVTRTIDIHGKSTWAINGSPSSNAKVSELCAKLKIQVDNLCQVLPQDRVQDFAKMNSKELLENTQKTVGDGRLAEWYQELKDSRAQLKQVKDQLATVNNKLTEQTYLCQRMEGDVRELEKWTKLLERVKLIEKKLLWLKYEQSAEVKGKAKAALEDARRRLAEVQAAVKPLNQRLQQLDSRLNKANNKIVSLEKQTHEDVKQLNGWNLRCVHRERKSKLERELERRESEESDRLSRLQTEVKHLESLRAKAGSVDEKGLENELRQVSSKLESLFDRIGETNSGMLVAQSNLDSANHQLRSVQSRLARETNSRQTKLKLLESMGNVKAAYDWFQDNKQLFSKPVYGPMFLELEVGSARAGQLLEQVVPPRELTAFVFQSSEDMSKFLKMAAGRQELKVNCVTSLGNESNERRPRVPLSQLTRFGFTDYLADLVQGPGPVTSYLTSMYHLHNIPIGPDSVKRHLDSLPASLSLYFAGNTVFRVSRSRYSSNVIHETSEMRPAQFLSQPEDRAAVAALRADEAAAKQALDEADGKYQQLADQLRQLEVQANQARETNKKLSLLLENSRLNAVLIRKQQETVAHLQQAATDLQTFRASTVQQIQEAVLEMARGEAARVALLAKVIASEHRVALLSTEAEIFSQARHSTQLKLDQHSDRIANAQEEVDNKTGEFETSQAEARRLLLQAKAGTGGLSPDDAAFAAEYGEAWAELRGNVAELEEEAEESRVAAACLGGADGSGGGAEDKLRLWRTAQETLAELTARQAQLGQTAAQLTADMTATRQLYLPVLQQLLQDINAKFSAFFFAMGCAGHVDLLSPDQEAVEEYGLGVQVKFREEGELQLLDRQVQSGGERALTTAVFLLSLQGLANVPFACVDEINQGMDELNERRLYTLLLDVVGRPAAPQYILLSPKLPRGMDLQGPITFHCIFNGVNAISHRQLHH